MKTKTYVPILLAAVFLMAMGAVPATPPAEKIKVILSGPESRVIVLAPQGMTDVSTSAVWFPKMHDKAGIKASRGYDYPHGLALLEVSATVTLPEIDVLSTEFGYPLQRLPALTADQVSQLQQLARQNGWH